MRILNILKGKAVLTQTERQTLGELVPTLKVIAELNMNTAHTLFAMHEDVEPNYLAFALTAGTPQTVAAQANRQEEGDRISTLCSTASAFEGLVIPLAEALLKKLNIQAAQGQEAQIS